MKRIVSIVLACVFGLVTGVSQLWATSPLTPGPTDRCQVCGMFVAPYPTWLAVAEMKDGRRFFFDGPKDLFVFFFDVPNNLPGASQKDIARLLVTEYYSTQQMPVENVILVVGSDVLGPMGQELVPVQGMTNARNFQRDHGGTKLMRFDGTELVEVLGD